jgi:hypothetical protein
VTATTTAPGSNSARVLAGSKRGLAEWVRTVFAVLTVVSTIFGAGAAWVAARSLVTADEADRAGFRQHVQQVEIATQVAGERQNSVLAYLQWRAAVAYRDALRDAARLAQSADAARLKLDAAAEDAVARNALRGIALAARADGAARLDLGTADRTRQFELEQARYAGLNPGREFRRADGSRKRAEKLAFFAAVLLVSAVAFTAAQALRTHASLVLFGGGVLFLVGGTAGAFLVWVSG